MYTTLEEADTYFQAVLRKDAWLDSNDEDRTTALLQAEGIVKNLAVPLFEELETYNYTVPIDVKGAVAEIALRLLEGVDPEEELDAVQASRLTFDKVSRSNKAMEIPLHILAGVPSYKAFTVLQQYIPNPTTVRLFRTG